MGVDQKSGRVYTIHIINAFSKVTTDHYKFLMPPCLCIIEREIAINHQVIIPRQPTISNLYYQSSKSEIISSSCPATDTSKLEKMTSGEKGELSIIYLPIFPRKCNSCNPDLELVSMMPSNFLLVSPSKNLVNLLIKDA